MMNTAFPRALLPKNVPDDLGAKVRINKERKAHTIVLFDSIGNDKISRRYSQALDHFSVIFGPETISTTK